MTPKDKAVELVYKFKDYVHGYVGSSMLINHEYPEQISSQVKQCALICVGEILHAYEFGGACSTNDLNYWKQVKLEIEKL